MQIILNPAQRIAWPIAKLPELSQREDRIYRLEKQGIADLSAIVRDFGLRARQPHVYPVEFHWQVKMHGAAEAVSGTDLDLFFRTISGHPGKVESFVLAHIPARAYYQYAYKDESGIEAQFTERVVFNRFKVKVPSIGYEIG